MINQIVILLLCSLIILRLTVRLISEHKIRLELQPGGLYVLWVKYHHNKITGELIPNTFRYKLIHLKNR